MAASVRHVLMLGAWQVTTTHTLGRLNAMTMLGLNECKRHAGLLTSMHVCSAQQSCLSCLQRGLGQLRTCAFQCLLDHGTCYLICLLKMCRCLHFGTFMLVVLAAVLSTMLI